jgi:[glutamine synthetase] adenylyltransferase / [glutamine synthetase]-adenylyl-L-tyrosine phosphorylase
VLCSEAGSIFVASDLSSGRLRPAEAGSGQRRDVESSIRSANSTENSENSSIVQGGRAGDLSGLRDRFSAGVMEALPGLLRETPDPDSALLMLERLVEESGEHMIGLLNRHPQVVHYAIMVFGHSRYLGETLIQNPDLLESLLNRSRLDRSCSREEFQGALTAFRSQGRESDISTLLARFKRREYVRIVLRDLLEIAPLAETTVEISALADALIAEAVREAENLLRERYRAGFGSSSDGPNAGKRFAVLSLGKLGGNELNYSSDVDLMYLFEDYRGPDAFAVQEYFVRLAQQVTEILSRVTREGPVFRIDLRLRPRGADGELAISLGQALRYYTSTAQDWELQALIKVRHSAGDGALTRAFIRGVEPHVYTEKINFPAIKTALVARERMQRQSSRRAAPGKMPAAINIKIDHGGIRDIEFLVQCLQRVYGGREPWLRSRGTLFALQKLHDKGHITGKEFHELTSAYEFLRCLEHRLQLRHGQQTHVLPSMNPELRIMASSMDRGEQAMRDASDLVTTVQQRMAAVSEIYKRVIFQQQAREVQDVEQTEFALRGGLERVAPEATNREILEQLARDSPRLHEIVCREGPGPVGRRNLFRFLSSARTSSERYAGVVRLPEAMERALKIFEVSEYLTDILVRHPEEIATLASLEDTPSRVGVGNLFDTTLSAVAAHGDPVLAYVAGSPSSYGEKLSLLRRHYRHRELAEGARDVGGLRDVYSSLAATTTAAEDVIGAAYRIAAPSGGVAVFALGRLGTSEFDVASDADLLFVRSEEGNPESVSRAVERMVQALAAYTQDGMVFAVDTRLRPRGGEGELVVTVPELEAYFQREAQAWEALLYTKLRFLAGDRGLGERTLQATQRLFERFEREPEVLPAIREMRRKLEENQDSDKNFKTAPGGTYDIDFITSYLLVKHGISEKSGTLRDRLWRCASEELLEKGKAARLDHEAELLRTVEHVVRLVVGRAWKWLPTTEHARQVTSELTGRILERSFEGGLEAELERGLREVREIYEQVLR